MGGPQSNQRGIETKLTKQEGDNGPEGLNRTSVGLKPSITMSSKYLDGMSLNRTSVGLKPYTVAVVDGRAVWPQSNQRGIETSLAERRSLNHLEPQSNQRGIETPPRAEAREGRLPASIEPAWD